MIVVMTQMMPPLSYSPGGGDGSDDALIAGLIIFACVWLVGGLAIAIWYSCKQNNKE